jgi:4'-phosphopantetheinyl transferase
MSDRPLRLRWAVAADFGERMAELLEALPPDERARADRFRVESARRRFVVARTILRHELAKQLGTDLAELVFGSGEHGKPFLLEPAQNEAARFNLSHSGELVVLVVGGVEVGIDIEYLRPLPRTEALARRFLSPKERRGVMSFEGRDRDRAFLRVWTQKEAYLKATGLGVGMPLRDLETEPDPVAGPRLVSVGGDFSEAARWQLFEVEIPNAVCTLAAPAGSRHLELRRVAADEL